MAGLRDAYRYTGNRVALDVSLKAAAWAEGILAKLDDAQVQAMLATEHGGMAEVLADLYADTGDRRWLVLSHRFDHRAVLDPLKRQEDHLSGLHGNTNIPKLIAAAVRYGYAGDPDDLRAAEFFWERVVRHHTFATGGHSKDEHFRDPDDYGEIVDGRTAETCNIYNMLKLTRRLFALQPKVEYAEFEERALFNHVLGSIDPADGATCYMVPVGHGVRREYADMEKSFTCCVGTGMENHALHGLGIYHESADRLWVNLYVPSRAEWTAKKARAHDGDGLPGRRPRDPDPRPPLSAAIHAGPAPPGLGGRGVRACGSTVKTSRTCPRRPRTSSWIGPGRTATRWRSRCPRRSASSPRPTCRAAWRSSGDRSCSPETWARSPTGASAKTCAARCRRRRP